MTGTPFGRPLAGGTVKAVNGTSSITVSSFTGSTQTILLSGSTTIHEAGKTVDLSAIKPGDRIMVQGTTTSSGIKATTIQVELPRVIGSVTAVNGSTITIKTANNRWFGNGGSTTTQSVTVTTSKSTTYQGQSGTSSLSAIKTGNSIIASGTLSSNGKSMTASQIIVLPAGSFQSGNGAGSFFGRPHGFFGGGAGPSGGNGGSNGFWNRGSWPGQGNNGSSSGGNTINA
jgi:hypothetical protein